MDYSTKKICNTCEKIKDLDEFGTLRGGKYINSYCKECCRKKRRENYRRFPEKEKAASKRNYWANIELNRKLNSLRANARRKENREMAKTIQEIMELMNKGQKAF